jgi:hypothetical protein
MHHDDTQGLHCSAEAVRVPQQADVEAGPQMVGVLRRKPGRGTSTLSMSCSDKIAKWQLVGWQGVLLQFVVLFRFDFTCLPSTGSFAKLAGAVGSNICIRTAGPD